METREEIINHIKLFNLSQEEMNKVEKMSHDELVEYDHNLTMAWFDSLIGD